MEKKVFFLIVLIIMGISMPSKGWAISLTPFGPFGEGGASNGQSFSIGTGGSVFEVDAFLNIGGMDLNGGFFGTSAQLSLDPLPVGLSYSFSSSLSLDSTDLTLSYTFSNNTGGFLSNVQFFSFLDAEIDEPINSFFNEYGDVIGTVGTGAADADPDSWEIDEPGFLFGDIYDNLFLGALDNSNGVPSSFPDDPSMALGFSLGGLNPLDAATINILISEDGDSIGSLALAHFDSDTRSNTVITLSGQSAVTPITSVPEPSTLVLLGSGLAAMIGLGRRMRDRI